MEEHEKHIEELNIKINEKRQILATKYSELNERQKLLAMEHLQKSCNEILADALSDAYIYARINTTTEKHNLQQLELEIGTDIPIKRIKIVFTYSFSLTSDSEQLQVEEYHRKYIFQKDLLRVQQKQDKMMSDI